MSKVLRFVQGLLRTEESDGALLFWAKEILGALLIISFFWMLSQLVEMLLNKWGRKLTAFTATDLDDRILQRSIPHIVRLLNVLGLYLAIRSLPLTDRIVAVMSGILFVVLVVIVFNLAYHTLDELIQWYLGRQQGTEALISRHMMPIAEKLALLLILSTALIIILKHFNYDPFSIITALGIGSLAIGLAAKDTLANMISGFTLMLDQPFHIGDRIKLASGLVGDVAEIGLRSTKIQGLDSTMLVIPNSDLCNSTVINMMRPNALTQGRVTLGVAYDSDVERVKTILLELAVQHPQVVAEPGPVALFTSFGESALNMLLLFWTSDPGAVGAVTDQLNCAVLKRFREEGIHLPFPTRTVVIEKQEA